MDDVAEFAAAVVPLLREECTALHEGDCGPRLRLWSHDEPVTLFGAVLTLVGWPAVEQGFAWLASTFHGSAGFDLEVLAAGVSADLGYVVGIERTVAATRPDAEPAPYALRVTTLFRRENGTWRVIHRHGDPFDPGSQSVPPRQSVASATGT